MNIVISGTGAVSGAGACQAALLENWQQAKVNRQTLPQSAPPFNAPRVVVGAKDFDPAAQLGKKGLQFLTRSTQLLLSAAHQAIQQAGFDLAADGRSLGLAVGTNFAHLATVANYDWTVVREGPSAVSAVDAPNTLANAPAAQLAIRLGAKSLNSTISTGRCASLDAIGYAAHFLEQDSARAVLAGGVEEINPHVLWQFDALGARDCEEPGEGAAVMLLQRDDGMNGHKPLARFAGWSNTLAPRQSPELQVQEVCEEVLELAELSGDDIRLVALNVIGEADLPVVAGTRQALFRGSRKPFPQTAAFSLKGLLGNTLGAAGALHAVAAIQAFQSKQVPASPGVAENIGLPGLEFSSEPRNFDVGPALIVERDPCGFASALLLVPVEI